MIKKLVKHGNSLALVIDKPILDLLNIEEETPLVITASDDCLVITPRRDENLDRRVRASIARINKKHARAWKRLAD